MTLFDSESRYVVSESTNTLYSSHYEIDVQSRISEYLEKPYKSDCISKSDYNQHDCYLDCLNKIIYTKFNCNLIHSNEENNFCHPLLVRIIETYKDNVLNDSFVYEMCRDCRVPCKVYFYTIQSNWQNHMVTNSYIISIIPNINAIHANEVAIMPITETLIAIISYVSLFFGGSLLSLIQIVYNISKNLKSILNQ